MGLISQLAALLFGGGRNALVETAQVFRENAEAAGQRQAAQSASAMAQFAAEFAHPRRGRFDRFMDAINRLPRPAMALGTLALIGAAMFDPVWFSSRMQGLALVPEPLWWLLGAVVSFYFGARAQAKGQEFQESLAQTLARSPAVMDNIAQLQALEPGDIAPPAAPGRAQGSPAQDASDPTAPNPALDAWRAAGGSAA